MSPDQSKQGAKATDQQEISFRLLVEQVKDYAIFLLDTTGHVVTWNAGAERLKGYRAVDIIGQHFSRFYPPEDIAAGKTDRELADAIADGRVEDEGWRLRKDGTRFWANVVITALHDESGKLRGFAKVTRDMTERRRSEEELRRANDDLERRVAQRTAEVTAANSELRRVDAQKNNFLAMLAHELRNPLAPVRNAIQILRQPGVEATTVGWARDMIDRQVRQLARLVDDLLEMSRLTRGLIRVNPQRLDLAQVAGIAAEDRRRMFEEAGLTLAITSPSEPVWVDGDPMRLNQAVSNLLDNAAKFTNRGGRVEVDVSRIASEAVIAVHDTGIGIAAEMLPRLFDIFSQVDGSLDRSRGGLGLGLALVKGLVGLHGGSVGAISDGTGKGATFTIRLPLATEDSAA